jgi:sugar phosphate isomerase/epimerase
MEKILSRRNFLGTAALGAGATMLPSNLTASEYAGIDEKSAQNLPPLKLGLMTYLIGSQWDLDTIIKNCTQTKFLHAELRTTQKHGVELMLNKSQRQDVKKKIADSALEAISLASAYQYHSPDQKILRENIEGTKEYLQLAADVGALGIRVFPNDLPDSVPEEKTMEQIGKSLAEVAKAGNDLGVEVRVEVHGRKTNQVHVIRKIVDYSQSPYVYVIWNCLREDLLGEGFQANYNMLKDRIKVLHMRDLYLEDYPYRELFRLLRADGFTGYCDCEVSRVSCEPIEFMKYYRAMFLAYQNVI